MFVDNVEIVIKAGNGGRGLASFRREKFLPFGGPDGGDGGKGADIYFLADSNMQDLATFKHKTVFKADNGGVGGPNKMHGLNAQSLTIKVPVGTAVYVKEDGKDLLVSDLKKDGQKVMAAKGGRGGQGNVHFATSTRKAPRMAQPGEKGQEMNIVLKVTLPIDVCIIGLANSGKSSLLAAISAARPKIADYPFTTTEPALGVVDDGVKKYVWGELPALTAGPRTANGAANKFLQQAGRAEVLVYVLDASSGDLKSNLNILQQEVAAYGGATGEKKSVVAVNKIDLIEDAEKARQELGAVGLPVYLVSAMEKRGLAELISGVHGMVTQEKAKAPGEAPPEVIFRPKPVDQVT